MFKRIMVMLMVLFVLTGCSFPMNFGDDSEKKEDLTLQLTNVDEKAGGTLDGDETYQQLNQLIQENPDLGAANDFSVYTVNPYQLETGESTLLLLGINRLPKAIHNIHFRFILKDEDGDYIYKDLPVHLTESEIGTFQPNKAMPFTVNISEEQMEQLNNLDVENSTLELNDFEYEEVEE